MARKRTRRVRHDQGKRTRTKTGKQSSYAATGPAPLKTAVVPSKARFDAMISRHHYVDLVGPGISDGGTFRVAVGDVVRIFGEGMALDPAPATYEYWIGRVCKIKLHHPTRGRTQTWLQVQWYYDATSQAPSLDKISLGRYERILSDAYDIVSSLSVAGPTEVVQFDDQELDQSPIPDGIFYTRRNYDSNKGMTPDPEASCGHCKGPYSPDGASMIFCPRFSCRRWFHQNCLEWQSSWRETGLSADDHAIERLRSSPSSDKLFSASPRRIRFQMKGRSKAPNLYEKLEQLEQPLVDCAKQRIARGGAKYGVAGNIKAVLEARDLVHRALNEDSGAAEGMGSWIEEYEIEDTCSDEGGDAEQEPEEPLFVCLFCKGAI